VNEDSGHADYQNPTVVNAKVFTCVDCNEFERILKLVIETSKANPPAYSFIGFHYRPMA